MYEKSLSLKFLESPQTSFREFATRGSSQHVRTLCQNGRQVMLAETLYSLKIDVCCVSETRIQDPSLVMHLITPRMNSALSNFSLRVSGDPGQTIVTKKPSFQPQTPGSRV
ncbi:hypothetical protein T265_01541 [Opisthorchis viverrini]|uniref:Uncharacterized protein n=1 Tax=Opisthorchis viverrini TaxID=6198 RepID=A0A075A241_OPIVI|nr:hypothetical protein T265_01541 [Opisthorchis viverrini]KER32312.1 hypothetical protein T265_01541 [Opisthorchis viverrini]